MSKRLIAFVGVAVVMAAAVIIFMTKSAFDAKERSGKIIEDFKKVDASLKRSTVVIDSANKASIDSIAVKLKR